MGEYQQEIDNALLYFALFNDNNSIHENISRSAVVTRESNAEYHLILGLCVKISSTT